MTNVFFNGPDLQEEDHLRLKTQIDTIKELMIDGEARTLRRIEQLTGYPPASISAQLRNLRKARFGNHTINRRHIGSGLYLYQMETA